MKTKTGDDRSRINSERGWENSNLHKTERDDLETDKPIDKEQKERGTHMKIKPIFASIILLMMANVLSAQTTAFTYQGKLSDGANSANGNYDIQFKLFDTAT